MEKNHRTQDHHARMEENPRRAGLERLQSTWLPLDITDASSRGSPAESLTWLEGGWSLWLAVSLSPEGDETGLQSEEQPCHPLKPWWESQLDRHRLLPQVGNDQWQAYLHAWDLAWLLPQTHHWDLSWPWKSLVGNGMKMNLFYIKKV